MVMTMCEGHIKCGGKIKSYLNPFLFVVFMINVVKV